MILIIKKGEGEYDSYYEYVESVWSIRKKKFDFEQEYQKHLVEKYQQAGLPVNLRIDNRGSANGIDFTLLKKKDFKQVSKVAKEWTPERFVKEVLRGKQLTFQDITL